MKKRNISRIVSALSGAVAGAVLVFVLLVVLGNINESGDKQETPPENSPLEESPAVSPSPSPAAAPASPTAEEAEDAGVFSYEVPEGYRKSSLIAEKESKIILTKGKEEQEKEYLELLDKLAGSETALDAPPFLPGKTITLSKVTEAEDHEMQLAREKEEFTTKQDLSAVRYKKVEGRHTYDVTYVTLPQGEKIVAVHMVYASQEPMFDEEGYMEVVNSLKPET